MPVLGPHCSKVQGLLAYGLVMAPSSKRLCPTVNPDVILATLEHKLFSFFCFENKLYPKDLSVSMQLLQINKYLKTCFHFENVVNPHKHKFSEILVISDT